MLLVSKRVEAISCSKVASFGGGFVCFFVRWLPERPSRGPSGLRRPLRGPSGSRSGLSEAPVAPGAVVPRPQWLPEPPFCGVSGSQSSPFEVPVRPGGSEASDIFVQPAHSLALALFPLHRTRRHGRGQGQGQRGEGSSGQGEGGWRLVPLLSPARARITRPAAFPRSQWLPEAFERSQWLPERPF